MTKRRLSDEEVRTIRRRRAAGESQGDLAQKFGVTQPCISNIVNGLRRIEAGGPIQQARQYSRRTT